MVAAVVRVRKSKAKRQVVSDTLDERKSSNCPFTLAHEILGILCAQWDWAETSCVMSQMDFIQTFKVECVIRRKELEEKRPLTSCVILLPFLSLPRCLHVSLTKFYQVVLDAAKSPPAEPHTKTLSLSLALHSPFFSQFHTHTCTRWHTHCVWGGCKVRALALAGAGTVGER